MDITGKTAPMTGASSGLGRQLAAEPHDSAVPGLVPA